MNDDLFEVSVTIKANPILTAQPNGGYVVTFKDYPEAITDGDSLESAYNNARDCLEKAIVRRLSICKDITQKLTKALGETIRENYMPGGKKHD